MKNKFPCLVGCLKIILNQHEIFSISTSLLHYSTLYALIPMFCPIKSNNKFLMFSYINKQPNNRKM